MTTLLLAPHADDESLFAAYTCQRERPKIVCCFDEGRNFGELAPAAGILGCEWVGFGIQRGAPAEALMRQLETFPYTEAEVVWAPAFHPDGHAEHNLVSLVARSLYGPRVRYYLTYAPRGHRQVDGQQVVPEPEQIARKLRALACYVSQMEDPATRPWFYELLDMREWVA